LRFCSAFPFPCLALRESLVWSGIPVRLRRKILCPQKKKPQKSPSRSRSQVTCRSPVNTSLAGKPPALSFAVFTPCSPFVALWESLVWSRIPVPFASQHARFSFSSKKICDVQLQVRIRSSCPNSHFPSPVAQAGPTAGFPASRVNGPLASLNIAVLPPSTTRSWQVTKRPASLAR
jgi:hypothetical protein